MSKFSVQEVLKYRKNIYFCALIFYGGFCKLALSGVESIFENKSLVREGVMRA